MKLPANKNLGALALGALLMATGLAIAPADARERKAPPADVSGPAGDYPVVIGAPFVVDGVTYTPSDTMNYDTVGKAVLLSADEASARISGAHRTLPVPSYVEVTSIDSGRTALVRLDQRGPMNGDGLVALSPLAWVQLGLPEVGTAPVRVRRVNPPETERALLRNGQTAPLRMDTPPGLLAALRRKLGAEPIARNLPVTVTPDAIAAMPAKVLQPKLMPPSKPVTPAKPISAPRQVPVASAPAQEASAPSARYFVQIGAFAQRGNADAAARKSGGSLLRSGSVWRVRSGPFSAGTAADGALAKARRAGYAGARIVRE